MSQQHWSLFLPVAAVALVAYRAHVQRMAAPFTAGFVYGFHRSVEARLAARAARLRS